MDKCNLKVTKCDLCGKEFSGRNPRTALIRHKIYCVDKHNFLEQYNLTKDNINELFIECGSVLEFQRKYPFRECNLFYYRVLKEFGIETSIKKASNSINSKIKRKKTNIKKHGYEHNFEKNSSSRLKWETRLLEEEGITNVFQREDVKKKSIETSMAKYGFKHASQCNEFKVTKEYCLKKYGEEVGLQKYNELCYNKGYSTRLEYFINKFGTELGPEKFEERKRNFICSPNNGSVSKLNLFFSDILKQLNIDFESEFVIKYENNYKKYDFKIGNTLIELNGEFWHANPEKYHDDDILSFPGGSVIAKNIWEKDLIKKDIAEKNGYKLIVYWEDYIKSKYGLDKIKEEIKKINYESSKN